MLKKRGQVTIFVIIAILIVAGIILFFYVQNKSSSLTPTIPKNIQPVYNFVQDCLKETGENALIRIGEQGGYFLIFDEPSIEGRIPYYLQGTQDSIPKQQEIEQNLAGFVREELSFCILNFKDFRQQYQISHELKESEVKILNNQVRFSLDYPLTITKDETAYQLKDFNVDIPVRADKIIKISQEVIAEQKLHPESICLSCLYDLGNNYGAHIDILDYGNSTIFTIIDDNSKINNASYEWSFAVK
jgi:hypothetical protein